VSKAPARNEADLRGVQHVPILSTITPGRERYCPILAAHLDEMWPRHAPVFFALPAGRSAPYTRAIPSAARTWTATLLNGLEYLRDAHGAKHVFVLLEDHFPLWPCAEDVLHETFAIVEAEDLKCVFFTKYEWPWQSTRHWIDEEGRVIGWRRIDVTRFRGHRMARMPLDFFRYNQCQPAIWNLDYYIGIVREAVRRGIGDPWKFEAYTMPEQAQHYVSEYRWPSWENGYLSSGRIDWRAVRLMKMPEARWLRDELVRERFDGVPLTPTMLYAVGECLYRLEVVGNVTSRVARRIRRTIR